MKSVLRLRLVTSVPSTSTLRRASWMAATTTNTADNCVAHDDIPKLFINGKVQKCLSRLNSFYDPKKTLAADNVDKTEDSVFELMSDNEIQEVLERVREQAGQRLRPPPVVNALGEPTVLADDEALSGHDTAKFVFTDISPGVPHSKRTMVVREPTGELRTASGDERGRLRRAYFDAPYSKTVLPKAFFSPYLEKCLDAEKHVHVLNWACYLMEPNERDYVRVATSVYDHVQAHRLFHLVESTRHWAQMLFYYVLNRREHDVMVHLLEAHRRPEAAEVARLHALVYDTFPIANDDKTLVSYAQLASGTNARLQQLINRTAQPRKARQ